MFATFSSVKFESPFDVVTGTELENVIRFEAAPTGTFSSPVTIRVR
jgi:hypothetical protein